MTNIKPTDRREEHAFRALGKMLRIRREFFQHDLCPSDPALSKLVGVGRAILEENLDVGSPHSKRLFGEFVRFLSWAIKDLIIEIERER